MEKLILTDYEKLLESHIAKLEEYVFHRLVLLQNQNTSLEKVRDSKRNIEQSLVSEIGKLSTEFDQLCSESEPEIDLEFLQHQQEEHENDVQLLLQILGKVYNREQRTEEKLQRELEKVKKEKANAEASSLTAADTKKIQVLCESATHAFEECVSKKQIQQDYIERLRADILLAEKKVNQLSFVLGQKRSHNNLPNYTELRKAVEKLKTLNNCGIHDWDECLEASVKEESAQSLTDDESRLFDEKVEQVRNFVVIREENVYIENVIQCLQSKLQELETYSDDIHAYHATLNDRYLTAKATFESKSSRLVSHVDEVQKEIFNAEIKTEIQNFLFSMIQKCLFSYGEFQPQDLCQPQMNLFVENMFPLDNRALSLLELCDKKQKLIFEAGRTRDSLIFRNSRIKIEASFFTIPLEVSMKAVEEIFSRRDQLESEMHAIEFIPVEAPEENDIVRDPEDEKIREQMESDLMKITLDIGQIKSEITLLNSELDQIFANCEALDKQIQKLKPFSNFKATNDEITSLTKELNSFVSRQHEIITECTAIRKELKFIVSRRDCAVNNFLSYLSNLNQTDKDYPKLEFLKEQVDDLKKAVQDAKSKLLKKTHKYIKI